MPFPSACHVFLFMSSVLDSLCFVCVCTSGFTCGEGLLMFPFILSSSFHPPPPCVSPVPFTPPFPFSLALALSLCVLCSLYYLCCACLFVISEGFCCCDVKVAICDFCVCVFVCVRVCLCVFVRVGELRFAVAFLSCLLLFMLFTLRYLECYSFTSPSVFHTWTILLLSRVRCARRHHFSSCESFFWVANEVGSYCWIPKPKCVHHSSRL